MSWTPALRVQILTDFVEVAHAYHAHQRLSPGFFSVERRAVPKQRRVARISRWLARPATWRLPYGEPCKVERHTCSSCGGPVELREGHPRPVHVGRCQPQRASA